MSPLEQARICIDMANEERSKMLKICAVLIEKLGNDVVVTHAELESIHPHTMIQQSDATALGFKISAKIAEVDTGKPN